MRLEFIALDKLSVSPANMRFAKRPPDVSDILPTVRAKGVLQTLLVRQNGTPDTFEIVAGSRRFRAASLVADERREAGDTNPPEPLPCAILEDADDAAAVEASLIENLARLDPDEVKQWETFSRLVKEGRDVAQISHTFGMPELTVKRVLALGNLLPRIRALYADEEIDRDTVRALTLATKRQQQEWLKLWDDPEQRAPRYGNLKAWLLGGETIRCDVALFEIKGSGLGIVADLFGDSAVFADAAAFWAKQDEAVEALRQTYAEAGWSDALVLPPSEHFYNWEYEKTPKRKGGKVFIQVLSSGEVVVHEGYVSRREAERTRRGGDDKGTETKPARPETTSTLETYIDLHRHSAVRAHLLAQPGVALRLLVAHLIVGSPLVRATPEAQSTRNDDVRQSVAESPGEALFDTRRRAVLAVIGASPDDPTVTGGNGDEIALGALFLRLLELPDPALMDVIAVVMGEVLQAGHAAVDCVAATLGTDMADWWEADTAFFGLLRDKAVLTAMMTEVAGATVAGANANEKGATMKKVIADHLDGADGRTKVERWVPKWLAFPPAAYTERGGVGSVRSNARALVARDMAAERDGDVADREGHSEPMGPPAPVAPEAEVIALAPEARTRDDEEGAGSADDLPEQLAA